jgi:chorismate lyase/3-hydroxybenzoate synthase
MVPEVPPWVFDLLDAEGKEWRAETKEWRKAEERLYVRTIRGQRFDLVSVWVRDAMAMDADTFERYSTSAYLLLAEGLGLCQAKHAVRLWNFIPGILSPLGKLPHRYMVFNTGRFEGYRQWYQSGDFDRLIPTASGVGHSGSDLLIHCLAAQKPGSPIENPRQLPAYRYSTRYGPTPPCFARATRVDETPDGISWLLVGGTASVLGEDSVHRELDQQIDETLNNLAALVSAALGRPELGRTLGDDVVQEMLGRFRHVRIYHVAQNSRPLILNRIGDRFDNVDHLEFIHADLCRPDLEVEIEGLVS